MSLSARRAWIEIIALFDFPVVPAVALRKESVDRNSSSRAALSVSSVALRKESVDRNKFVNPYKLTMIVALRKESVDRNGCLTMTGGLGAGSLSARRAWIEMLLLFWSISR